MYDMRLIPLIFFKEVFLMFFKKFIDSIKRLGLKDPKKVVYTVITNDYDDLITPDYINEDWDYICFTDTDIESDFWQIKQMEDINIDPVRKSKKYKILPHYYLSDYHYSLYIDGNCVIIGDLNEYINKYSINNSMLCLIHPDRNCIYDEAEVCILFKKDYEDIILAQINKYLVEGYPKNNGLVAGGILFRKHNDQFIRDVMDAWWNEINSYSYRDQLSFNYVCWKKDFKYDICGLSCWGNEYFRWIPHKL